MTEEKKKILVVEDNDMLRALLVARLREDKTMEVEQARSGADGLDLLSAGMFHVVLLDMMLPDMDGLQFMEQIQSRGHKTSVVAMTAASESLVPDSIVRVPFGNLVGAVFRKPFDQARLVATVKSLASARQSF